MFSEVTMQPRTRGIAGRPFRGILATLLLVVSLLGCVLALPLAATARADAESPLAISKQVSGVAAPGAVSGVSSMTRNSTNSTLAAFNPDITAVQPAAGALSQKSATYLVGCAVTAIGCLVLAVFSFIWLLCLSAPEAQALRRLPSGAQGLIMRLALLIRAPSLFALSISRT